MIKNRLTTYHNRVYIQIKHISKRNQEGLSLTELLVASMLIGIVMLGVVGFNVAITSLSETSRKSSVGSIQTAATMARLKRDIENVVGDVNNPGILENPSIISNGDRVVTLAIRQEAGTPEDYSDDNWVCWAVGVSGDLKRCVNPPHFVNGRPNPPKQATVQECTGIPWQNYCVDFLKTNNIDFMDVNRDTDGRILYIDLTLSYLANTEKDVHLLSNPETIYRTRINPSMTTE